MFSVMMNEVDEMDPESDDEYDSRWQQSVPQQHSINANTGKQTECNLTRANSIKHRVKGIYITE